MLYAVLIATSIMMIVPFYWSLSTSLKLEQNVFANPPQWIPNPLTWANFDKVINSQPSTSSII
jgi:multiple sugar transport system permease protein